MSEAIGEKAADPTDIHAGDWVDRLLPRWAEPYARLAVMLNDVRGWAKATLPTYQDRKQFFEGIVNGDLDPIALLRAGDEGAVQELIVAAQRECETARV